MRTESAAIADAVTEHARITAGCRGFSRRNLNACCRGEACGRRPIWPRLADQGSARHNRPTPVFQYQNAAGARGSGQPLIFTLGAPSARPYRGWRRTKSGGRILIYSHADQTGGTRPAKPPRHGPRGGDHWGWDSWRWPRRSAALNIPRPESAGCSALPPPSKFSIRCGDRRWRHEERGWRARSSAWRLRSS